MRTISSTAKAASHQAVSQIHLPLKQIAWDIMRHTRPVMSNLTDLPQCTNDSRQEDFHYAECWCPYSVLFCQWHNSLFAHFSSACCCSARSPITNVSVLFRLINRWSILYSLTATFSENRFLIWYFVTTVSAATTLGLCAEINVNKKTWLAKQTVCFNFFQSTMVPTHFLKWFVLISWSLLAACNGASCHFPCDLGLSNQHRDLPWWNWCPS